MDNILHDLDYNFLGVRENFNIKIVVRLRRASYAILQAITFCNMTIIEKNRDKNRARLHIRKFRYTLKIFKIKILVYINVNILQRSDLWSTFFINIFSPFKFRFYKQRYYIRFFLGINNISISISPNRYGTFLATQLYTLYSESSLSPVFKRTKRDNKRLFREIMAQY